MKYSLADYVANAFKLAGSMLARPFIFLSEQKKAAAGKGEERMTNRRCRLEAHLGGAARVADRPADRRHLCRAALLRRHGLRQTAWMISSNSSGWRNCRNTSSGGSIILAGAYALAGAILHAGQKSRDEKLIGVEKPLVPPFLGFTEATIVLGAVNVLFLLFVIIQFQYFFGGQTNIGVEGYTYAEYARKGFGELVAVAVFSTLLFLGLSAVVKRQNQAQRWIFSALGVLLVVLVGVMLVSAYQRLVLYETAYGFTRLRTYTHVFMIWLGALLAVVVVLDLLRKERSIALAMLLAALGFGVSLTITQRGWVHRTAEPQPGGAGRGTGCGAPGVAFQGCHPLAGGSLQDETLPGDIRDKAGAALACSRNEKMSGTVEDDWRSFTLSRLRADRAVESVSLLDSYTFIDEDDWRLQVETPLGETYDCWMGELRLGGWWEINQPGRNSLPGFFYYSSFPGFFVSLCQVFPHPELHDAADEVQGQRLVDGEADGTLGTCVAGQFPGELFDTRRSRIKPNVMLIGSKVNQVAVQVKGGHLVADLLGRLGRGLLDGLPQFLQNYLHLQREGGNILINSVEMETTCFHETSGKVRLAQSNERISVPAVPHLVNAIFHMEISKRADQPGNDAEREADDTDDPEPLLL